MFTTLSTICVPINTGFTSSFSIPYPLLFESRAVALLKIVAVVARLLEGEHDFRLGFPLVVEWRVPGAVGLPLDADAGLLGTNVLELTEESRERLGVSKGFNGLGFTVGEVPRDGAVFFSVVVRVFVDEEDRDPETDTIGMDDGVDGRRVGVADLDADLGAAGLEVLPVGVEERRAALVGVEDLAVEATGLTEGKVALEVGVEALEGLDVELRGRPVGVADLVEVAFFPPDDEGLPFPAEEFLLRDIAGCPVELIFEKIPSSEFAG